MTITGSPSRPPTVAVRLALAAIAALLGSLSFAAPALAHSDLASSDPAASTRLATPPSQLTLTFTDQVNPQFVTIRLSVEGAAAVDLPHATSGKQVTAQAPSSTESQASDQTWTVTYRIVSADGHPISGSYAFTVAAAPPPTTTSTGPTSGTPATNAPLTSTATASPTSAATTPAPSSTSSVQPDAFGPLSGRDNTTGNRLPIGVMAIIAIPLLAVAGSAVWWFRRPSRPRE